MQFQSCYAIDSKFGKYRKYWNVLKCSVTYVWRPPNVQLNTRSNDTQVLNWRILIAMKYHNILVILEFVVLKFSFRFRVVSYQRGPKAKASINVIDHSFGTKENAASHIILYPKWYTQIAQWTASDDKKPIKNPIGALYPAQIQVDILEPHMELRYRIIIYHDMQEILRSTLVCKGYPWCCSWTSGVNATWTTLLFSVPSWPCTLKPWQGLDLVWSLYQVANTFTQHRSYCQQSMIWFLRYVLVAGSRLSVLRVYVHICYCIVTLWTNCRFPNTALQCV